MNIQELILAALKTKFPGVEDAILLRIAEKKAVGVTDESQVTQIVEGVGFQDVLQSYGDFRANGATASAVSNYEKKYSLKDGKPIEKPKVDTKPPVETPEWAKALIDSQKSLTEKLEKFEAEKAAAERKSLIASKVKSLGLPEGLASMLNIPEDADVDEFLKDAKQTFVNMGLKTSEKPDRSKGAENEVSELAKQIGEGTKQILESKK